MYKRLISMTLAICLAFTNFFGYFGEIDFNFGGVDLAYADTTSDGFEYSVKSDGTIEITKYKGTATTLSIPDQIGTKTVTSIGDLAFNGCTKLTRVRIPSTVKSIGNHAFMNCISLTIMIIPESVTSIGDSAFSQCISLKSVTLSSNLTSVGTFVFSKCSSLTTVNMLFGVKEIGAYQFYECSKLTNINIPASVTKIESTAFKESGLTTICGIKGTAAYTYATTNGIDFESELYSNGLEYEIVNNNSIDIIGYKGTSESVAIPSKIYGYPVIAIGDKAFDRCADLTKVTIPSSIRSIGHYAFYYCSNLKSIKIPDSVTFIGFSAFDGCNGLTSLVIPDSVKTIRARAFYGCSGLTSLTISNNLTNIEEYTFGACKNLTEVTIPKSVTSIASSAFINSGLKCIFGVKGSCAQTYANNNGIAFRDINEKNFKYTVEGDGSVKIKSYIGTDKVVTIPSTIEGKTVTTIGASAFFLKGITSVTIPNTIKTIEVAAFRECTELKYIVIPNSVKTLGEDAFRGCTSLTSIILPNTLKEIKDSTFMGCTSLTGIAIPATVESIGSSAFNGCTSLPSITIPASVKYIDLTAFYDSGVKCIYGERDSYAKTYANNRGIEFKAINPIYIDGPNITVEPIGDRIYTGVGRYPTVTVKHGTTKLVKGVDYTLKYAKNKSIGTATITITGINDYTGTRTTTFRVVPKKATGLTQTDRTTGTIEMSWDKQEGGVKYQLYRATSKNGTYTRVINTQYTTYRDGGRSSGKIYYYKVRAYKVVDSKNYYGTYSDVFTACTKCKTPTVTVTSPSSGKAKVTWNEIQGADGYQVKRATSSDGEYETAKTVTSGSTTSYTNTGRKSGSTYYYKVRAYKMVDGKKIYSSYSKVKSIKVK